MDTKICYCFNYTATDIRLDFARNGGRSQILEQILTAKQQGTCRCQAEHPQRR